MHYIKLADNFFLERNLRAFSITENYLNKNKNSFNHIYVNFDAHEKQNNE